MAVTGIHRHSVQTFGRPSLHRATTSDGLDATWAQPADSRSVTSPLETAIHPPLGEGKGGRCSGPRDHLPPGAQVSMSQMRPASRPASPPSVESSTSNQHNSPAATRSSLRGAGDPPSEDGSQESGSIRSLHGDRPQLIQRGFGVHNILNPQDLNVNTNTPAPTATQAMVIQGSPVATYPAQYGPSRPTQRPSSFQGHGVHAQHSERRFSGEPVAIGGPPPGRGSPGTIHPWPALGGPRRYITPRSPRASSMSHGPHVRTGSDHTPHHSAPDVFDGSRIVTNDNSVERLSHGHSSQPLAPTPSGIALPGILTTGSAPNFNSPARSLSQPMLSRANTVAQEQPSRHAEALSQQQRAPIFPSPSSYAASIPPSTREYPAAPPSDPRWPPVLGAQQGVRSTGMPEEQSTLMFATPGGEPVEFVVDTTNASRHADEKRLRNAGASARFRQRKKDKDQQKDSAIEKLQMQNRELERRIKELESERERYRADRDRLRDVVHRTSSISDLAYQGPRSPPLRKMGSFTAGTPYGGATTGRPPSGLPPSMDPYGTGDSVTGERPSRRRRTEAQVEVGPVTYGQPLHPPSYNQSGSQPGTPSMGGHLDRLPPLRLELPPGGLPTSGVSSTNTPSQSYSPLKREPYESGWVTRPGGPPDVGHR